MGVAVVPVYACLVLLLVQSPLIAAKCRSITKFPPCPSSWTLFEANCYLKVTTERRFLQAEDHCQNYTEPGRPCHLTSILSSGENDFIANMTSGTARTWIGYHDADVEGTFAWLDGSNTGYEKWGVGFDNAYDFIAFANEGWYGNARTKAIPSVCKMAALH